MKLTTVQVKFDADRHTALMRYAAKKEISVEQELTDCLEKLYKKIVPPDVRDYIENRDEPVKGKGSSDKRKIPDNRSESEKTNIVQNENYFGK